MPIDNTLRVLIVDDHVGIRIGIASLIDAESPVMCCIGAVGTAVEALAHTRRLQPDVVVLDVNLAGEDGLALIPVLHDSSRCVVVVLTSLLDHRISARARELGATACLHKTAPAADLLACIAAARDASRATSASPLGCGERSAPPRR